MDPNTLCNLELTAAEWNVVGAGLMELPMKTAAPIFEKIRQQVAAQAKAEKTE